jgi:uroporphyrinogen-III synthase
VRILLTRPADENARIAGMLEPLGALCLAWPLTRIVPLVRGLEVPEGTDAILFTSANAVRAFAAASPVRRLPALCVGDRTAACARSEGFAEVRSAGGAAADLARLARESGHRHFLHPRGREAGEIALDGAPVGARVEAVAVYAAEPAGAPPADVAQALAEGSIGLVTVWSPRHAAILRGWIAAAGPPLGATRLLGISAAAVAPLHGAGFAEVLVAARPDASGMAERVGALLRQ